MSSRIRVDIWWDGLASYAAACWRELARQPNIDLHVLTIQLPSSSNANFDRSILSDVPATLVPLEGLSSAIEQRIKQRPHLVALTGWARKPYRLAVKRLTRLGTNVLISIDTPWRGTIRQLVGLIPLRVYAKNFCGAIVPGERAWQYGYRLGFTDRHIYKILYGVDDRLLSQSYLARTASEWPRSFLFVGRLVKEKDIETLTRGYEEYRRSVSDPWSLSCVGEGPEREKLRTVSGIRPLGFLQPDAMADVWKSHGAFVISSSFDPWPLAIVEACRSGLPVIHSTACGSAVETVRENFNGFSFATGNSAQLAKAFISVHNKYDFLPTMGERSRALSECYTSERWASNWAEMARSICITQHMNASHV